MKTEDIHTARKYWTQASPSYSPDFPSPSPGQASGRVASVLHIRNPVSRTGQLLCATSSVKTVLRSPRLTNSSFSQLKCCTPHRVSTSSIPPPALNLVQAPDTQFCSTFHHDSPSNMTHRTITRDRACLYLKGTSWADRVYDLASLCGQTVQIDLECKIQA